MVLLDLSEDTLLVRFQIKDIKTNLEVLNQTIFAKGPVYFLNDSKFVTEAPNDWIIYFHL